MRHGPVKRFFLGASHFPPYFLSTSNGNCERPSPLRVPHPACPDAGRERSSRRVGFFVFRFVSLLLAHHGLTLAVLNEPLATVTCHPEPSRCLRRTAVRDLLFAVRFALRPYGCPILPALNAFSEVKAYVKGGLFVSPARPPFVECGGSTPLSPSVFVLTFRCHPEPGRPLLANGVRDLLFAVRCSLCSSPLRVPHPACPDAGRERPSRRVGLFVSPARPPFVECGGSTPLSPSVFVLTFRCHPEPGRPLLANGVRDLLFAVRFVFRLLLATSH